MPFALLDEGHTGVALFMTLSGYLFAKLLGDKDIHFLRFLWNRSIRLAPLLIVVLTILGVSTLLQQEDIVGYLQSVARGLIYPSLPHGGWSITVEMHFYLLLPFLLAGMRRYPWFPLIVVGVAIFVRYGFYVRDGGVQSLAYWTIVGRIDQFLLGMLFYRISRLATHRHGVAVLCFIGFSLFYWRFAQEGGFYLLPSYPSDNAVWIVLPTIEGAIYGFAIAWYETSFVHSQKRFSRFIAWIGQLSYSMYLLHFFFVFHAAQFIHEHVMDISNFYLATLWSGVFFVAMLPMAYASYRWIESPFLRFRKKYIVNPMSL